MSHDILYKAIRTSSIDNKYEVLVEEGLINTYLYISLLTKNFFGLTKRKLLFYKRFSNRNEAVPVAEAFVKAFETHPVFKEE